MSNVDQVKQKFEMVDLGGRDRALIMNMNSYVELERLYGTVDMAFQKLEEGLVKDVRNILWAALIHDEVVIDNFTGDIIEYKITPYGVGSWIQDIGELQELATKLAKTITASMPNQDANATVTTKAEKPATKKHKTDVARVAPTAEEVAENAKN